MRDRRRPAVEEWKRDRYPEHGRDIVVDRKPSGPRAERHVGDALRSCQFHLGGSGLFVGTGRRERQRPSGVQGLGRTIAVDAVEPSFVERTEDLPISFLVRGACKTDPGDEVAAAYDAPFPTPASKAGARAFPLMLPTSPEDPGAAEGERTAQSISERDIPSLCLWADSDPIIPLKTGAAVAERLGLPAPETIPDASHFLQEDQGRMIGERIARWLRDSAS